MSEYHNDKLLLLANLLLPEDEKLIEELNLAINNPVGYITKFQEQLSYRGIDEPFPELPWIALVDGLTMQNRLVEIDWNTELEDITWNIDQLLQAESDEPNRWTWAETRIWEEKPTEEFLKAAADMFNKRGLALVYLDINSDSYPLLLIKVEQLAQSQKLAEEAGYGKIIALSIFGKGEYDYTNNY
jgi:hypothetical protein